MASGFVTLLQAVKGLLVQTPALAGGRVELGRGKPVPPEHPSAVHVSLANSQNTTKLLSAPRSMWRSFVAVDVLVRGAPGQSVQEAVDPLLQEVWERLQAQSDAALGAHLELHDASIEWGVAEADSALCGATLLIPVRHQVLNTTLALSS